MCIVVYIASSAPLQTSQWKEGNGVTITDVPPNSPDVRNQFSYPNIYYVASSESCGCGFRTNFKDDEAKEQALNERRDISKIIKAVAAPEQTFQLLIAYSGYETEEIDTRWRLRTDELENCDFDKAWDYDVILVDVDNTGPITKPSM